MEQETLEVPVIVGQIAVAPTTELAGLAELSHTQSLEARIAVLARVATALRDEDRIRDQVNHLRERDELLPLPRRR